VVYKIIFDVPWPGIIEIVQVNVLQGEPLIEYVGSS